VPLALRDYEKQLLKEALKHVNNRRNQPVAPGDLADWFERITNNDSVNVVANEVNEVLCQKDIVKLVPQLQIKRGRRRLDYVPDRDLYKGRSWAAMATALILDERFGLTKRLKQCGNPVCKKFNLDIKPHGRPRGNCNKTCQRKAEAAQSVRRSRLYRENKQKQDMTNKHKIVVIKQIQKSKKGILLRNIITDGLNIKEKKKILDELIESEKVRYSTLSDLYIWVNNRR